jgi:hypothetical protein
MNHVVTETSPGELGVGCSCGKRFPTRNAAELHASDQNLIEKNEAKAKKSDKAEAHAAELAKQPKEPRQPEKEPEDESDSTPDPRQTRSRSRRRSSRQRLPRRRRRPKLSALPTCRSILRTCRLTRSTSSARRWRNPACSRTSQTVPRRW